MTDKELFLDLFLQEFNSMPEELMEMLLKENLKIIRTIKNKQVTKLTQSLPLHCQGVDKSISYKEEYFALDPEAPGDLTHTKPIRSVISGKEIDDTDWIKIVRKIHIIALKQGLSLKNLIELSSVKANVIQVDRKGEKGYHYLPEIDISIQGVDANRAWKIILHLAKNLNIPIEVYFEWKKGSNAGKKRKFIWKPKYIKMN